MANLPEQQQATLEELIAVTEKRIAKFNVSNLCTHGANLRGKARQSEAEGARVSIYLSSCGSGSLGGAFWYMYVARSWRLSRMC